MFSERDLNDKDQNICKFVLGIVKGYVWMKRFTKMSLGTLIHFLFLPEQYNNSLIMDILKRLMSFQFSSFTPPWTYEQNSSTTEKLWLVITTKQQIAGTVHDHGGVGILNFTMSIVKWPNSVSSYNPIQKLLSIKKLLNN